MIQVPFVSAPELCFTEELAKTVAGSTVFIRPGTAPYSRLVVEELATIDQARDQFLTLKRAMLAASLNVGCGIYIKNNLIVFDDDRAQLPSEPDQPFVCRQERNLAHLIITVGEPQFQLPHALPKLIESIEIAMTSKFAVEAICDQSVALACDLYTSSFYEKTFASRFISLIGVLEVLKDQDRVSPEAIRLIDAWLDTLDQLESAEATSLRDQLEFMKLISISRGISSVVTRHLGPDRTREVRKLYKIRSKLIHTGEHPDNLRDSLELTEIIVRELLIKILLAGSR